MELGRAAVYLETMVPVCKLCDKIIPSYHPLLNHVVIDDDREVDICPECLDRIRKSQQAAYATLFPTSAAKRYLTRTGRKKG